MKKTYSIKEVKRIFKNINQEEEKTNDIKINSNLLTIVEYYKSNTLKKSLKITEPIKSIRKITAPLYLKGWYNLNNRELIVIISGLYERLEFYSENGLIHLIRIIYHELRHRYQAEKMKDTNKFKDFLIAIEKTLIHKYPSYYKLNWSNFLIEIDADEDAIKKTEDYLKRNDNISREELKTIKKITKEITRNKDLHNPIAIYEQFNFILQKEIKKHTKESDNPLNDSIIDLNPNIDSETYNNMKRTLSLIYNQDGSYKSIKEIISETSRIDNKIINTILCTKSFLKSIKINNLEDTEIKYMLHILEELYQNENKRLEILKNISNDEQTILGLYNEKKIIKQLRKIIAIRSVLMNILLNKKKIERDVSLYTYVKKGKSK